MKKSLLKNSVLKNHPLLLFLVLILLPLTTIKGQSTPIKNGVNIQASYYNRGRVNLGWDLMKDYPEIEALRIEIEPYRASQAVQWIREAHKHGYQVIATYHNSDQLGSDKAENLQAAANWWRINYKSFTNSGPVLINIMNEWGSHSITAKAYAAAYNEAITIIREVYEGPLIVDVPGFGQATKIAVDAFPHFKDQQIIFSVHIYSTAFNQAENRWLTEADLSHLSTAGVGCMVGEFCDVGRGGTDWCSLIDYCYQNNWPIFGWAWNGDGGRMNMISPHWRDQPLATSFRPTPTMDKIINKLAGIPCYTQPDSDCNATLIGTSCDDKNDYTINDRYNEYCHCTGTFTPFLQSNIDAPILLLYPNPIGEKNQITIELIKIREQGVIAIYNMAGHQVKTMPVLLHEKQIRFNTIDLPNGIYWVTFHGKRETVTTKSLIK